MSWVRSTVQELVHDVPTDPGASLSAGRNVGMEDFENLLRQDPRWETTKNGMNTLMNTVTSFSKSWGFVK